MEENLLLSPYGSFGYKNCDCENQEYINIFAVPHNRFLRKNKDSGSLEYLYFDIKMLNY